jgi:hypothetical protein
VIAEAIVLAEVETAVFDQIEKPSQTSDTGAKMAVDHARGPMTTAPVAHDGSNQGRIEVVVFQSPPTRAGPVSGNASRIARHLSGAMACVELASR